MCNIGFVKDFYFKIPKAHFSRPNDFWVPHAWSLLHCRTTLHLTSIHLLYHYLLYMCKFLVLETTPTPGLGPTFFPFFWIPLMPISVNHHHEVPKTLRDLGQNCHFTQAFRAWKKANIFPKFVKILPLKELKSSHHYNFAVSVTKSTWTCFLKL